MRSFQRDDWILALGILILGMLLGWWMRSRRDTQTIIIAPRSSSPSPFPAYMNSAGYDQNPNVIKFYLVEQATGKFLTTPTYVAKKQFSNDEQLTSTGDRSDAPVWQWVQVPNKRIGDVALGRIQSGKVCWSLGAKDSVVVRDCGASQGQIELWQDPRTLNVIKSSGGSCVRLVNGKLEKFACTLPFPIQIQSA